MLCGNRARGARSYEIFDSTRQRNGRKEGIRNRIIQELKSNGKESALELFKQLNKMEYGGMYTEAMCEQWISDFQKTDER